MATDYLIEFRNVNKRFGGVVALRDLSFGIRKQTTTALLGENGAGKSTLVKILGGIHRRDSGTILWEGRETEIKNPRDAERLGISIVHQETPLCRNLTVAANIFLGPKLPGRTGFPDWKVINKETERLFEMLDVSLNPSELAGKCSIAQQQLIMIAKAIRKESRFLILDEPTSALSPVEVNTLFSVINKLKAKGITILFISHRLEEVLQICDHISVMKDGAYVGELAREEATVEKMAQMMVGREVTDVYRNTKKTIGAPVLEVKNLSHAETRLKDISFVLKKGEVLGIAGLRGAGRTELAKCIFGVLRPDTGEILLDGKRVEFRSPRDAITHGIGYLTEDRGRLGLLPEMDIKSNISLAILDRLARLGLVNMGGMRSTADRLREALQVNTRNLETRVRTLSGGNQQKVLFGRWLASKPKILILDEPTRGIDVGTKAEIRKLIVALSEEGYSIIIISSELLELLAICDRLLVMSQGRITGEFSGDEATEEKIMMSAVGA